MWLATTCCSRTSVNSLPGSTLSCPQWSPQQAVRWHLQKPEPPGKNCGNYSPGSDLRCCATLIRLVSVRLGAEPGSKACGPRSLWLTPTARSPPGWHRTSRLSTPVVQRHDLLV